MLRRQFPAFFKNRFAGIKVRLRQGWLLVAVQTKGAQHLDITDEGGIGERLLDGLIVKLHAIDIIVFNHQVSQRLRIGGLLECLLIQSCKRRPVLQIPVDATQHAVCGIGIAAFWPALEIGLCLFLREQGVFTVDSRDIKIAIFADAVLAAFVQRRAHQHILRGFRQPRAIALKQRREGLRGAFVFTRVKMGRAGQIGFIRQGR